MKYIYVQKAKHTEQIWKEPYTIHFSISKLATLYIYLISNYDCFRPKNIWHISDKTFYLLYVFNCFFYIPVYKFNFKSFNV